MKFIQGLSVSLISTFIVSSAFSQTAPAAPPEVRIGIVTFLSGPAASPFGVPARNAAELMIEQFNAGTAPAPYNQKVLVGQISKWF